MQRIRTIKPRFFIAESVASVSFGARLLFIGLWTIADREGRLVWKPKEIKAQVFPHDDVALEPLAGELVGAGLVRFYAVDESVYAWLPGFLEHQRPHPKEPASLIPAWPTGADRRFTPWPATADHGGPGSFPSSPVVREGKGREGTREGNRATLIQGNDPRCAFTAPTFKVPTSWELQAVQASHGRLTRTLMLQFYADFQAWVEDEQPDLTGPRLFRALDQRLALWQEKRAAEAELEAGRATVRQLREMDAAWQAKQGGAA